jgi:hypothetical protein
VLDDITGYLLFQMLLGGLRERLGPTATTRTSAATV